MTTKGEGEFRDPEADNPKRDQTIWQTVEDLPYPQRYARMPKSHESEFF